jgi:hypothetical protein
MLKMHWLSSFAGIVHSYGYKGEAVRDLTDRAKLTTEQTKKLDVSGVVKVPRNGYAEIVSCDCQDGEHTEELKDLLKSR